MKCTDFLLEYLYCSTSYFAFVWGMYVVADDLSDVLSLIFSFPSD